MRQVMPHRNNIVAGCRGCKTFLHRMGNRPLFSGDCCKPVPDRRWRQNANKIYYNNGL
jgi:hypothetical protein